MIECKTIKEFEVVDFFYDFKTKILVIFSKNKIIIIENGREFFIQLLKLDI